MNVRTASGRSAIKAHIFHTREQRYDYVLNVLFAAGEITDEKVEDIFGLSNADTGLKHLCREAIRKHLLGVDANVNLFQRIPKLGLPSLLVNYLLYHTSLDHCDAEHF